ncbi:MAG: hypothetical protein NT015_13245 [Alphaproteobacteria bacterium]|nr:hypothetical protein [Alphaproteobacteria bacterium]
MSNWFADKLGPAPRVSTGLGAAKPSQEPTPQRAPLQSTPQQARAPEPQRQQAAAPPPKAAAPAPAPKAEEPKKKKGWF